MYMYTFYCGTIIDSSQQTIKFLIIHEHRSPLITTLPQHVYFLFSSWADRRCTQCSKRSHENLFPKQHEVTNHYLPHLRVLHPGYPYARGNSSETAGFVCNCARGEDKELVKPNSLRNSKHRGKRLLRALICMLIFNDSHPWTVFYEIRWFYLYFSFSPMQTIPACIGNTIVSHNLSSKQS